MLLVDYLDELGFVSDVAGTAEEARAKLCTLGADLDAVIMDLGLPDAADGTLVEEFRGLHPTMPIIIASGYDMRTLRERFAGLPAQDFLTKPFRIDDVRTSLARLGIIGRASSPKS